MNKYELDLSGFALEFIKKGRLDMIQQILNSLEFELIKNMGHLSVDQWNGIKKRLTEAYDAETAEVFKSAENIKHYCKNTRCSECRFHKDGHDIGICVFTVGSSPAFWELEDSKW